MSDFRRIRPTAGEFAPYYAGYVELVPAGDIVEILAAQQPELLELLGGLPADRLDYRYAPGKWTPREVIGHVADTERVMSYRALCFARGDRVELPGFEESLYVEHAGSGDRSLDSLLAELRAVREASLTLFRSLDREAWARTGRASGQTVSVRGLAFIIAGHAQHHVNILRERYLGTGPDAAASGTPADGGR